MADTPLRILVIGAHPDDCEVTCGGTATLYRQAGHRVKFVSLTNGESGHHEIFGEELVEMRRAEAQAAAATAGIESAVLDFPDGRLEPSFEARCVLIQLIREFNPDLVLTHRPNDYHPDHRYTSQLVCDAAYMVTVPPVVPEVPALRDNPAIAYVADDFRKPIPFEPTVVVDIGSTIESAVDMLHCHTSQFYGWLAYNHRYDHELPAGDDERREFLGRLFRERIGGLADRFREQLVATYGEQRGAEIQWIEAFERCEYGRPWDQDLIRKLFPFVPSP
jgi:LmbE family N-acetylglucosaminyl deacetylase